MIDVANKFNMVDMGGIDIVESQGVAVEGLFSRLLTAIQNCRYQVLYNWKFAKIEIVPSYVELVFDGTRVYINESVSVTEDDVVHVYSLEPTIAIEPLVVEENGEYEVPAGVDGFNPVTVTTSSIKWKTQTEWDSMTFFEKKQAGLTLIGSTGSISGKYFDFSTIEHTYIVKPGNILDLLYLDGYNFHGFYSTVAGDRASAGGRGVTWSNSANRFICNALPVGGGYGFFAAFALNENDLAGTNTSFYGVCRVDGYSMYLGGNIVGAWGDNADVTFTHDGVTSNLQSQFSLPEYTLYFTTYPSAGTVVFDSQYNIILSEIEEFLNTYEGE